LVVSSVNELMTQRVAVPAAPARVTGTDGGAIGTDEPPQFQVPSSVLAVQLSFSSMAIGVTLEIAASVKFEGVQGPASTGCCVPESVPVWIVPVSSGAPVSVGKVIAPLSDGAPESVAGGGVLVLFEQAWVANAPRNPVTPSVENRINLDISSTSLESVYGSLEESHFLPPPGTEVWRRAGLRFATL
jgi:hypothetical protein